LLPALSIPLCRSGNPKVLFKDILLGEEATFFFPLLGVALYSREHCVQIFGKGVALLRGAALAAGVAVSGSSRRRSGLGSALPFPIEFGAGASADAFGGEPLGPNAEFKEVLPASEASEDAAPNVTVGFADALGLSVATEGQALVNDQLGADANAQGLLSPLESSSNAEELPALGGLHPA
jgi:hypothetical protein